MWPNVWWQRYPSEERVRAARNRELGDSRGCMEDFTAGCLLRQFRWLCGIRQASVSTGGHNHADEAFDQRG